MMAVSVWASSNGVLVAALVLSLVLTINFFYGVQRLELREREGELCQRPSSWRRLTAFSGAALLPALSVVLVLMLASLPWSSLTQLVGTYAVLGLLLHQLMDAILRPRG